MIDLDRHSASAYARPSEGRRRSTLAVHETSPAEPAKPRLLDRVRTALRSRHYSRRTEEAYVAWIRRYILFHGKRHAMEMGVPQITRFLSFLAVDGKVAASTQNQALLEENHDIRTVQELLGHRDVTTTQIYAHVLNRGLSGVRSPADGMPEA